MLSVKAALVRERDSQIERSRSSSAGGLASLGAEAPAMLLGEDAGANSCEGFGLSVDPGL
jgi:hypothetical protein